MEERVGIAQINVNGRPDLLVGPAGPPERGMPTTPRRRLNGPRRQCPPGHRWTWRGCRPARRVHSDVDLDRVLGIARAVKSRFSGLAEASLADIASGNYKPSSKSEKGQTLWYLEYVGTNSANKSGTSSKFYKVAVDGSKVTITWGKIGTKGQTKTATMHNPATAVAYAKGLVAKKKVRGYKEV